MLTYIKQTLKSKTIWKAIITGLAGITVAVLTEFNLVGYIVIANAAFDIILRAVTTQPLSAK